MFHLLRDGDKGVLPVHKVTTVVSTVNSKYSAGSVVVGQHNTKQCNTETCVLISEQ